MKKILIANRGEIAIRVMKTAKKMGIKTVAVYSEADRNAPHVRFADEAVYIGEAPSNKSYLVGDRIIDEAKKLNVDAIHPGYGFLSENANFAEQVEKSGIIFIGPKSDAIRIMGSKLAAKEAVKSYNIPMVPGVDRAVTDPKEAIEIAKKIGFPILIKASAGGGGKGMRTVENETDLEIQMKRAISEAISAFGDGSVFVEKYISSPRHIEIQILADSFGNTLHFFERECSIQRRHQKVIEEAPSSILTPEIRTKMGEAAIKVAKSCNYIGAGTVEFLMDADLNFYFLEMNTRLQVEHPVTELITGFDLVELQIKIARGEKLLIKQEDLKINGHALELRVYAEDSMNNFLPSVGKLSVYQLPVGKGIRVDNGFEAGMDIPIYYDPMLSKLITYGKTRKEAIELMIDAIDNYKIVGAKTTLPFGKFVCNHEAFRSGNFDTHFVKNYYSAAKLQKEIEAEAKIAASVALKLYLDEQKLLKTPLT
ncbi:acetyl/propionyl/methylcrotonyl-CoA carboxylase subunit alpha [Lutibacter sp.]|uniref:acetyl-CoA carboxylase biotin carboxylase subunit n=1 Tax=Lutibacter sp. TaxID=1925666 RepID=UPI001A21BAE1|nr:acetyl-CoA carboxylase biotin carboxylase subunit [Lutibacter sp.]MBI9041849.1 acetyl-CoA carboxylase biotin carboxylase subunit [Lutibacter sp.]